MRMEMYRSQPVTGELYSHSKHVTGLPNDSLLLVGLAWTSHYAARDVFLHPGLQPRGSMCREPGLFHFVYILFTLQSSDEILSLGL